MTEKSNDKVPSGSGKKPDSSTERPLHSMLGNPDMSSLGDPLPSAFLSDAREGLDQLKDAEQLELVLHQLNRQLHQQLKQKKTNKKRRSSWDMKWIYGTIFIILLLTIAAFTVIRFLLHR
jgi:hypothetical protein